MPGYTLAIIPEEQDFWVGDHGDGGYTFHRRYAGEWCYQFKATEEQAVKWLKGTGYVRYHVEPGAPLEGFYRIQMSEEVKAAWKKARERGEQDA